MPKELLFSVSISDCEVQHFRAGGKGGENQNKRDTGTRVIHHPSGARGEARDQRSQAQNTKSAFLRMTATQLFKHWASQKAAVHGRNLEAEVRKEMEPHNLRVEHYREGGWQVAE